MNLIKIAIRSSNTIALQKIDARVGVIKACGMGSRASKQMSLRQVKPAFDSVVADALDHHAGSASILDNADRFAPHGHRCAISHLFLG